MGCVRECVSWVRERRLCAEQGHSSGGYLIIHLSVDGGEQRLLHASDASVLGQDASRQSREDASAEDGLREVLLVRELLQLAGAVVDDGLRTRMRRMTSIKEMWRMKQSKLYTKQ
jgi:hypothetical protein